MSGHQTLSLSAMLLLLLALLWAGESLRLWVGEAAADPAFPAGSLAEDGRYKLTVQGPVVVQEGLCVFVPCSFIYLGNDWYNDHPTYGYWFQKGVNELQDPPAATNKQDRAVQEETQGRFQLLGDPGNYNCSLHIRDAQRRDTGRYFFRVEKDFYVKHSYKRNQLTVHVTALKHTPDILIPGPLESGHPTNLTCSVPWACEQGTPPLFSWTSAAHTSLGPRTHLSSVLTLTPRAQDHGTNLTCQVQFPAVGVTVDRTIQLNVTCVPQNPAIGACLGDSPAPTVLEDGSSLVVTEGEYLRLVCDVDSNPPARLSWTRQKWIQSSPEPGVLELPRVQVGDAGKFTCQARNPQGFLNLSVNLLLPTGKLGPLSGVTLGALGGAGVSTLLFLFCIVVFIARSYRKKAARAIADTGDTGMDGAVATTRTISQGPLIESGPGNLADHPAPAPAVSSLGETGEIQYATLRFQQMKPRNPQEQEEVPENEYSEIKISK